MQALYPVGYRPSIRAEVDVAYQEMVGETVPALADVLDRCLWHEIVENLDEKLIRKKRYAAFSARRG